MRNFQKNGRLKHLMQSKTFLIFFGIIIIIFFHSMFGFVGKMEETIKNKKIVEDKIIELEKSKEKLNSDIVKLKTDKGIEENIREKFGLVKEGENMILVVEDKNLKKEQRETNSADFWSWFRGLFK